MPSRARATPRASAQQLEDASDAFDRLIGREVDTDIDETQRFIYDGQHIALSLANNGDVQNRYHTRSHFGRPWCSQDYPIQLLPTWSQQLKETI